MTLIQAAFLGFGSGLGIGAVAAFLFLKSHSRRVTEAAEEARFIGSRGCARAKGAEGGAPPRAPGTTTASLPEESSVRAPPRKAQCTLRSK